MQNFASHKKGCAKNEVKGRLSLLRFLLGRRKILRLYWAYAIIVLNKTGCARQFKSKLLLRSLALFLNKTGYARQFKSKLLLRSLALFLNKTGCARQSKSRLSSRLLVLFLRKITRKIHNTPNESNGREAWNLQLS